MKPKLHILSNHKSIYFLKWEVPFFEKYFTLVDSPSKDSVLLAFGPDKLLEGSELPALLRTAVVFPWWGFNPYHDLGVRKRMLAVIDSSYDAVFVNPGPVRIGLAESDKLHVQPFSIDVDNIRRFFRTRTRLDSLLHLSADAPQKDWRRSEEVMRLTGLRSEVFPPRRTSDAQVTMKDRIVWRYNKYIVSRLSPTSSFRFNLGYSDHRKAIERYRGYDGFVHIAGEVLDNLHLDGKYTAALLEAAVTGAIVFWHDTFSDGNNFETVFSLSKDPAVAAEQILELRDSIDVEAHSQRTSDEISEACHPHRSVQFRSSVIQELLDEASGKSK